MKISVNSLSIVVTSLIIGLIITQVIIVIKVSSFGKQLTEIEKERAQLAQTNQETREEIAYNQSLLLIASKAPEFGLARPSQILYLTPAVTGQILAQSLH